MPNYTFSTDKVTFKNETQYPGIQFECCLYQKNEDGMAVNFVAKSITAYNKMAADLNNRVQALIDDFFKITQDKQYLDEPYSVGYCNCCTIRFAKDLRTQSMIQIIRVLNSCVALDDEDCKNFATLTKLSLDQVKFAIAKPAAPAPSIPDNTVAQDIKKIYAELALQRELNKQLLSDNKDLEQRLNALQSQFTILAQTVKNNSSATSASSYETYQPAPAFGSVTRTTGQ